MFGGNTSAAGATGNAYFLILQLAASPYVAAYSCYSTTFGNKYSDPAVLPSAVLTGSFGTSVVYNPFGVSADILLYSSDAYEWSSSTGFGAKYAAPSPALANNPHSLTLNNTYNIDSGVFYTAAVFGMNSPSPYVKAYKWIPTNGYGAAYSAPSVAPAASVRGAAFNAIGSVLALAVSGTQLIEAYNWTNSGGFGTRFSNPSGAGLSAAHAVAFNADDTAIIFAGNGSPYIAAYAWSNTTGFGTKYSNPASLPPGICYKVVFNPTYTAVAVVSQTSPYIAVYPWSNATGFGTKYSNPSTPIPGAARAVAFSPDNKLIAVGHASSPYISLYEWSDSTGFGNKLDNPLVGITSEVQGISFSGVL